MSTAKTSKFTPTVTLRDGASCYDVRNGWAWAYIFVRHGSSGYGDQLRHWVHVAVISDYGSFGFCWSHIGEDWRRFLAGLDMHYAMQKFMGERFHVAMDAHECMEQVQAYAIRSRRDGALNREEARELFDAATTANTGDGCTLFLNALAQEAGDLWGRLDLWDLGYRKVNPQAEGFWKEIWPHFAEALRGRQL